MKNNQLPDFSIDKVNRKIKVKIEFTAPISIIWATWTESQLLDQWWAPNPWKTKTKMMDFREGGYWLYAIIGPDGEEHWARADFESIVRLKGYSAREAFCDDNGNINHLSPLSFWTNKFSEGPNSSVVSIEIRYKELADLERIMELGFKEGFTATLKNLGDFLEKKEPNRY